MQDTIVGNIHFKDVSLYYSETEIEALKRINFQLAPGQTLGILGKLVLENHASRSACTIVRILPRVPLNWMVMI